MGWVAIPLAVLGLAALSGGNQTTEYQYVECVDYSQSAPVYAQQAAYGQPAGYYGGQQYAQQAPYAPAPAYGGQYAPRTSYAPASGGHYGHAGHYGSYDNGYGGTASMQMGGEGASIGVNTYGSGY